VTSKKLRSPSTEGLEEQSTDSVYDFLYHDARRIASFLSQFDQFGHLTGLQRTEQAERSKTESGKIEASGGLPSIFSGGGSHTHDVSAAMSRENARTYDPLWTNALAFLDYLSERELIQRDITGARIGQFLLVKGRLAITDLAMVRRSMELPAIKKMMNPQQPDARNRRERRAAQAAGDAPDMNLQDMVMEMLTILPHTVQGRVYTHDGHAIWSTLDRSSLVVAVEDLFLKHGVAIGGEWAMLGIVDALPGNYGDLDGELSIMTEIDPDEPGSELLARISASIVPLSKLFLGRPDASHGVTPLLIFREVSGE
jgi:hypothetical protein